MSTTRYIFEAANKNTDIWTKLLWISGGNLNPEKCFYYYLEPHYNHSSGHIKYKRIKQSPGDIHIQDPETNQTTPVKRLEPSDGKRTLGVILAPDGNCSTQIKTSHDIAATYVGKLKHSKLSKQAKWTAVTTILEPGVLYPLMALNSTKRDLEKIDKILATVKCHALGLNEHFPRAILHGPLAPGGMAIPNTITKTTATRLTYFFYHIRLNTNVGKKLDASITFLQLETGTFNQFLSTPYQLYGHLVTKTLIKTIWGETEPNNIQLRPSPGATWNPEPQGTQDIALIDIAVANCSQPNSQIINRYRLYLQVISLYDIITYDGQTIHPNIMRGERILSRHSTIYWVDFKRPPKKHLTIWQNFLTEHVTPLLKRAAIQWYTHITPNFKHTFFHSSHDNKLYQSLPEGYLVYAPKQKSAINNNTYYTSTMLSFPDQTIITSLQAVEVFHEPKLIMILGRTDINTHGLKTSTANNNTLQDLYDALPNSLKRLCGKIHLPPDGGAKLMEYVMTNNSPIFGASDASLKNNNCSHAWVVTSNNPEHLHDPDMIIHGAGPVDGHYKYLSSARGELQGQTAAAIAIQQLLRAHKSHCTPVHLYGDNQGIQNKCTTFRPRKMKSHREPNIDLLLEYQTTTKNMQKQNHWVGSHQDKDTPWDTTTELLDLKLSPEATLKVLCDKMATDARLNNTSFPDADVLPSEKWALFACHPVMHKITCKLETALMNSLYHDDMQAYIASKHGLTEAKLENIMTN